MASQPNFNFIGRKSRASSSRVFVGFVFGGLAVALWVGIWDLGPRNQSARIGELVSSSPSPTPSRPPVPIIVSDDVLGTDRITSPSGSHQVFVDSSGDGFSVIMVAGRDGTYPYSLLRTRASSIAVSWPQEGVVAFASQRLDRSGKDVTLINLATKELSPLLEDQKNLEYVWAPSGAYLLFSTSRDSNLSLMILNIAARTTFTVPLVTGAEKCAWLPDESGLVCGVPRQQSLPADIPSREISTNDSLVLFDFMTGLSRVLWEGTVNSPVSMYRPQVTADGSLITFTNLFDKKRYSLTI